MQKIRKVALAFFSTAVLIISLYFVGLSINNPISDHTTTLDPENFSVFRYSVPTGPYAGLGVIRVEYIGSVTLPGNLTIQAHYKDTGEIVLGEVSVTSIEPSWRTEIPVYRASNAEVNITIEYNGESIVLTA
jgi:hypothetical protein